MTPEGDSDFIPSSYSRIVARVLALHEKDLEKLLQGTGLPTRILLPGDETHMTGLQQVTVLRNARRMAESAEFGLRLGQQLQPAAHGPLGYLALSSPDLITALRSLRDFLPMRIPFAKLKVDLDESWLRCSLRFWLTTEPEEERILLECFVLVIQSVVESILGRELTEGKVEVTYGRPEYVASYGQYIHPPIAFSMSRNSFLLPAELAYTPNASGDANSYAQAQAMCRRLLQQFPGSSLSMADQVRRLLLSQPGGSVDEAAIARALFVSRRTLGRRLEKEGTGYRQIRDAVLAELAGRHLRESELSVEAIAALMGYQDTANFRRAFRRWFGQSPGAYRRTARNSEENRAQ